MTNRKDFNPDIIPINVEGLIRFHGVELDKNADLPAEVLGQIEKKADGKYKISIQKNDHYFRKRFTMAHELGHFLLHKDKIGEQGLDDSKAYRALYRRGINITADEEIEANRYAALTLMPEDYVLYFMKEKGVIRNDGSLDEDVIKDIAATFQVSPKAMEIRIKNLI